VTPATLVLRRVEVKLVERLEQLEGRLRDEPALWCEYARLGAALATIAGAIAPGAGGRLMTTAELAESLGVSPKTILRKRKAGELTPALELGRRGRGALRWGA
jgi:hypothetical protein